MIVSSNGIKNGMIDDKYGKRGSQFSPGGIPTYSLPFKIEDAPLGTKSYALVLFDKDAYEVSGFVWFHWLAANITRSSLDENESIDAKDFVQGYNSWVSIQGGSLTREECSVYGGMSPPNADHVYELKVYALDKLLELKNGFSLPELYKKMSGHVLDSFTLKGIYKV